MINRTEDFISEVCKKLKAIPEFSFPINLMEAKPKQKTSQVKINIKLRSTCETCNREWTSAYGVSMWHYYFKNGSLKMKVQVYTQQCKRCLKTGNLRCYEDEIDRQCEEFLNEIFEEKFPGRELPFEDRRQRGGNDRHKKHEKSLCAACKAGVCNYKKKKK